jgi:hypothetical protein
LAKLTFVAPTIADAIAAGRPSIGENLQMLMDGRLALAPWCFEQQRMFAGIWIDQLRRLRLGCDSS